MNIRRLEGLRCLAIVLCCAAGGRTGATAQLLGPEFQVNSYETGYQEFPAVAADAVGNFVVVWRNTCAYCAVPGIFGRRMDATGAPAGAEFQVNTYTTNVQGFPAVAADALGNFVVVWASQIDGCADGRLRTDGSTLLRSPQGGEFQVNSFTTSDQRSPAVATDGSGNFVVVWISYGQDGNGLGVFGQRFSSSGTPLGSEFQVEQLHDRAAVRALGGSGCRRRLRRGLAEPGQDGDGWGVFGQRFSSPGAPQGLEFQVNSYTTGDQLYPKVASDAAGDFRGGWQSVPQDGEQLGRVRPTLRRRRTAAGERSFRSTATPRMPSTGPRWQRMPRATSSSSGTAAPRTARSADIFGRRFSSSGVAMGSDFQINAFTSGGQQLPAVAADGAGELRSSSGRVSTTVPTPAYSADR